MQSFYVSLTHVTVHAKCSPTPYWEILWSFAQFEPFTSLGFVISALAGTRLGITFMSLKQWWFMTTRLACIYGPRQNMESSVCHFSIFWPISSLTVIFLFVFTLPCTWTSINFLYSLLCSPWIHLYIHPFIGQSSYYTERNDRSIF